MSLNITEPVRGARKIRAILEFEELDGAPRILPVTDTQEEAEAVTRRIQEAFS